jgi:hypothetical protein
MNFQSIFLWLSAVAALFFGHRSWGWTGVVLVLSVAVFWLLLHFTRLMQVLKKAANRPKGLVDSAVMLNAKLKSRMTLMQVIGLTRSLGEPVSATPEVWRWTDNTNSSVSCEFVRGKLVQFSLQRPAEPDDQAAPNASGSVLISPRAAP